MGLFDINRLVDAQKFSGNAKATIQANGRLGFSAEAANVLELTTDKTLLLSDIGDGNYAVIICDSENPQGFKIQKGGNYFYTRMKNYFDSQEIDYLEKKIIYDISRTKETFNNIPVFRFNRREINKTEEENNFF